MLLMVAFAADAQSAAKQKLLAMEKMRFDALTNRDTTTLSRLLADDLIFMHTNGVIENKSSLLKSIATGSLIYLFILPETSTATVDGNIGWVYGKANIRFKVASINMTIDQYISFINFYRLIHDQWQLVACQNARVSKDNPYFVDPQPQVKKNVQPFIY
ncbi:MAG: nuclear transport factor 2 family protein [Bacteroidota bacterium]|nr:nuclear transport factor 2 family protein [Bacteroidota bacterium]MDP4212995.1 nuclear transport factor 2 family protein [Bacteroidota bacterium]MDP4249983.1 nuclear transport factor 2 family protein [Bacteroidota bacterium]